MNVPHPPLKVSLKKLKKIKTRFLKFKSNDIQPILQAQNNLKAHIDQVEHSVGVKMNLIHFNRTSIDETNNKYNFI